MINTDVFVGHLNLQVNMKISDHFYYQTEIRKNDIASHLDFKYIPQKTRHICSKANKKVTEEQ